MYEERARPYPGHFNSISRLCILFEPLALSFLSSRPTVAANCPWGGERVRSSDGLKTSTGVIPPGGRGRTDGRTNGPCKRRNADVCCYVKEHRIYDRTLRDMLVWQELYILRKCAKERNCGALSVASSIRWRKRAAASGQESPNERTNE